MEGSTGSPSEDDLDRFLADIDAQTKRTEHFWETVSRFKKLLEEKGVMFDDPAEEEEWYKSDERINERLEERIQEREAALERELSEEEEFEISQEVIEEGRRPINAIAERYSNRGHLRYLAAIVAMKEEVDSVRGQNTAPPNFKKRLQAEHMVRGLDEAWVQVIESEVPGEGVSDEDAGLIAEVALEMITGNEESRAWFESRRAQMADLLQQQGLELTEEAEIAIIQLCYLGFSVKARQFISPEHMTSSAIEEARVILNRQNLTDPAWYRLIDIFFNAM